jgi:hypothetical protein
VTATVAASVPRDDADVTPPRRAARRGTYPLTVRGNGTGVTASPPLSLVVTAVRASRSRSRGTVSVRRRQRHDARDARATNFTGAITAAVTGCRGVTATVAPIAATPRR